jgi:hypothetical protein
MVDHLNEQRPLGQLAILGLLYAGAKLTLVTLPQLNPWLPIEPAIAMFAILSIVSALAGAVYEHRHEWGSKPGTHLNAPPNGGATAKPSTQSRGGFVDTGFRPKSAVATQQIAQLAARGGGGERGVIQSAIPQQF